MDIQRREGPPASGDPVEVVAGTVAWKDRGTQIQGLGAETPAGAA